jgi:pimeloyl-ACP methyl ester carboxylesterase
MIITQRWHLIAESTAGILLAASAFGHAQTVNMPASKSGYAPVNGLKMYYEFHGTGQPLILIHGGLGATEMFDEIMPSLAKNRQVIAVDLQGQGRTADIDRAMSFDALADDIAGVASYLGIEKADVMGYSFGGTVALRAAIRHPALIRKLLIVSAPCRRDGWFPEILSAMAQMGPATADPMKQTPMYQLYARIAPRPEDWPVLLSKLGDLSRKEYDWSKDVAAIEAPTLLVFGDADAVRTADAVQFFESLGGGQRDGGWDRTGVSNARLAILPGTTHYSILSSPMLLADVTAFLDSVEARSK